MDQPVGPTQEPGRDVPAAATPAIERLVKPLPHVAVVGLDATGRVTGLWGTDLSRFGLTHPDEAVGHLLEEFVPESLMRELRPRLELALQGVPQEYTDGDDPGALRMEILPAQDGDVTASVIVMTPAPWMLRLAPRTGLSLESLEELVDSAPVLIAAYDDQMRLRYVNAAIERFSGLPREVLLGRRPDEWGLPEDLVAQWRVPYEETLRTGAAVEYRTTIPGPDGPRVFQSKVEPVGRREDRRIVAIGVDVTERVAAEQALANSERLFRLAFHESPIGSALVGMDGRLQRVNPAMGSLVGQLPHELEGLHLTHLLYPEDRGRAADEALEVLAGRRESYQVEVRLRLTAGVVRWVSLTGALVRDEQGLPQYALVHLEDITDRRRSHEALQERALHDELTGLANRAYLLERLGQAVEHARRHQREVAVLFCDLDGFKEVNDHFGHRIGDRVLHEIGNRLRRTVRAEDTAARFGGDEFVVVCEDVVEHGEIDRLVGRVQEVVSRPLDVDDLDMPGLKISVGVAFSDQAGLEPSALLEAADSAMFRQKSRSAR